MLLQSSDMKKAITFKAGLDKFIGSSTRS
jgi:hypothetical protein